MAELEFSDDEILARVAVAMQAQETQEKTKSDENAELKRGGRMHARTRTSGCPGPLRLEKIGEGAVLLHETPRPLDIKVLRGMGFKAVLNLVPSEGYSVSSYLSLNDERDFVEAAGMKYR